MRSSCPPGRAGLLPATLLVPGLPRLFPAALFFAALVGSGCASQVPPPGGPPDTSPPEVVTTYPAQGTLGFSDDRMAVEFSEYMDKGSFNSALLISPPLRSVRTEWSGTRAEITFDDTLRPQTTYIITLGTGLKDSRNNRIPEALSFAFSTGPVIDSGAVSGRVHDPVPAMVSIFAYRLGDDAGGAGSAAGAAVEGPDPRLSRPDYATQSGDDGRFVLRHMRPGRYRVIAVRDEFQNLLYDVQTDEFGMSSRDVVAGDPAALHPIGFTLSREDSSAPFITGLHPTDDTHLALRFNEPVVQGGRASFAVTPAAGPGGEPAGAGPVTVAEATPDSSGREILLTTTPMDRGAGYLLGLSGITDVAGNALRAADTDSIFAAASSADTTAPALLSSPADGASDVSPGSLIRLAFSEPVDTAAFNGALRVANDTGAAVGGTLEWRGRAAAVFTPAPPLDPGARVSMTFVTDSVRDDAGNVLGAGRERAAETAKGETAKPAVMKIGFAIAEERSLGSLAGTVVPVPGVQGRIIVRAVKVGGSVDVLEEVDAGADGAFRFDYLPGGKYALRAYVDLDGNGRYSPGSPWPAALAEPAGVYPDTISLRPRWPVDGAKIVIIP